MVSITIAAAANKFINNTDFTFANIITTIDTNLAAVL